MSNTRNSPPLRVGILGYSDIARRKFIPALLQSNRAVFSAVASRQPDTYTGTQAVEALTYQQLLDSAEIELVYISLPNHLHEEWCLRALERGKHVICEKPLGLSSTSVKRMLDAAEQHGRLLYENLMYLQHPQHGIVKSLVEQGRIGRVTALHSEFAFPGPNSGDFRLDPSMGGGAFHDMNRYPLSAALTFLEGASYRFVCGERTVRDGLTMSLQAEAVTSCDERLTFLTAFGQTYRSFYELRGSCGSIRVERAYTTPADMANRIVLAVNGREETLTVEPHDHFLATIDHVCGLLQRGNWTYEHERSRKLAGLAELFLEACGEKEYGDED